MDGREFRVEVEVAVPGILIEKLVCNLAKPNRCGANKASIYDIKHPKDVDNRADETLCNTISSIQVENPRICLRRHNILPSLISHRELVHR